MRIARKDKILKGFAFESDASASSVPRPLRIAHAPAASLGSLLTNDPTLTAPPPPLFALAVSIHHSFAPDIANISPFVNIYGKIVVWFMTMIISHAQWRVRNMSWYILNKYLIRIATAAHCAGAVGGDSTGLHTRLASLSLSFCLFIRSSLHEKVAGNCGLEVKFKNENFRTFAGIRT